MQRILLLLMLSWLAPHWALALEPARDLAQIRASGELRVLINQSRHTSGVIAEHKIGVELARLEAFVGYLNSRPETAPIKLKLLPMPGPELYAALLRGEGDLVVSAELLGPPPSSKIIPSFTSANQVPLVVVARRGNRQYANERGLSGRFFSLPAGTQAIAGLKALSTRLQAQGLAPVDYSVLEPHLAVEDVLELLDSGALLLTVVEQPIAERWLAVYPRLRIDRHLPLDQEGRPAWYLSRKALALQTSLQAFSQQYRATPVLSQPLQQAYRQRYRLQNPLGRLELARLGRVSGVLQQQAQAHDLDWRLLAAIAFKESTLNPQARGAGAATGLMQITPATARANGVQNPASLEHNVLAAARYLQRLRQRFFANPAIEEAERQAFILAAYNMGPQRVQRLREEAARRGLDAERWYGHVERVALETLGIRGSNYVSAVSKYHWMYQREGEFLER